MMVGIPKGAFAALLGSLLRVADAHAQAVAPSEPLPVVDRATGLTSPADGAPSHLLGDSEGIMTPAMESSTPPADRSGATRTGLTCSAPGDVPVLPPNAPLRADPTLGTSVPASAARRAPLKARSSLSPELEEATRTSW